MPKLVDYLNLLDTDATARATHAEGPTAAMTQFGLNDAEQQAVLSGDKAAIAKLAGVDLEDGKSTQVACFKDPT